MSAKRSRMEIESDSEGSDDDVGMEIDQLGNVNVNMELKGLSIEEEDFSGIKQLLCPLLPKSNVNVSGLTDDIIGQNFIGHIIKQVDERSEEANEEDPVLSISTIIPLNDQRPDKIKIIILYYYYLVIVSKLKKNQFL